MIPVVLNTPESMVKVRVMTVKDYSERVLKTLHKIGLLHVEESKELKPVDKAALEQEHREVNDLLSRLNDALSYVSQEKQVMLEEDVEVIYTRPFDEVSEEVKLLYNKIDQLHTKIVEIDDEAKQLSELTKYLEPLAKQANMSLEDLRFSGEQLFSRVFTLNSGTYQDLQSNLKNCLFENISATVEDETVFHAVAEIKDRNTVETIISNAGGKTIPIPNKNLTLRNFLQATSDSISNLKVESNQMREELQGKIRQDISRLTLLREALSAENERLAVLEKASEARYVTLIEGWIPDGDVSTAIAAVREDIDYAFIDTRKPEEGEEPPTKMKNGGGIKPFQTIINLFATPKYREWDPTPIVAYSFALFFGLMVCDVLYALGLFLLAKFLLGRFVDDPNTDNFKLFQRMIYICSGVALVGGLLTGQYFGDIYIFFGIESLALAPPLQQALQDPVTFILVALGIGFIHVNIGHLIAFIKGIKEKQKGIIVSKIGLFLFELGIPAILSSMLNMNLPGLTPEINSFLLYFMIPGAVLIVISSIMMSGGLGAIMWLFDVTGLLGDVMSYARLAGVGLATYYLASTFNMMAGLFGEMIPGTAGVIIGGIIGVFIVAFGHIINMVLTAITGFMHSLRLCFVEFMFKFYEGGGREYSPFRLRKRLVIPLATRT